MSADNVVAALIRLVNLGWTVREIERLTYGQLGWLMEMLDQG